MTGAFVPSSSARTSFAAAVRKTSDGTEPAVRRTFDGREHVLETALVADLIPVRRWMVIIGTGIGVHDSADDVHVPVGMAGRVTMAGVQNLITPGGINLGWLQLPGVFVDRRRFPVGVSVCPWKTPSGLRSGCE